MAKARVTLELNEDDLQRLQEVAAALGYRQTRGPGAGSLPNVSALIRALAALPTARLVAGLECMEIGGGSGERT